MLRANDSSLFALILAAGQGTRFGATKQLADFGGQPLVRRAVALAESICPGQSILVLGHEAGAILAAAQPFAGFAVCNANYRDGMGTSLARGIRALPGHTAGALVLLCDQPWISAADIERLVNAWRQNPQQPAACRYGATIGVPAIFPRRCFADLATLSDDKGAQALIKNNLSQVSLVECPAAARDIDTPEDLAAESAQH